MTKQEIYDEVDKIVNKAKVEDRYSLFMFDCIRKFIYGDEITAEQLLDDFNLVKEWDDVSKLPYNLGALLNELEQDNNVDVGIHRTSFEYKNDGSKVPRNPELEDIMCNGLINNGHANAVGGSAFLDRVAPPALTVSEFKGLGGIVNLTGSYKHNNTTIIFVFPKGLLDEDFDYADDSKIPLIYTGSELTPRIKNNYIVGAIIKNDTGLDSFYLRDEILENRYNVEHNISNK